jgi:geranylgeranylglycerol-phosphate geranylgeranyltransferase
MITIPSAPKQEGHPNRIQAFAQLCRPTLSSLAALAGCLTVYVLAPETSMQLYLQVATALIGMTAGAFAINDYDDIEKDRINHPERPLPSGTLLPAHAWWTAVLLFTVALLATVPLGEACSVLVVLSAILLWNYSSILNVSGILGNFVVAMIVAALILFASLAVSQPLSMLYPSAFLFCYILAKEIVWDIHDAVGDRKRGVTTIANTWGAKPAFVIAWGLLALLLISIPVASSILPMAHPGLFGLCALVMLVSFALALRRYQRQQTLSTYTNLIILGRLGMIVGLIGLISTTQPL